MALKISKGKKSKPMLILVYGPDGVGKTSLGAHFPRPIFVGPENGSDFLDVTRYEGISSYKLFLQALDEIKKNKKDFDTVVIDSLDWIEQDIEKSIREKYNVDSVEKAAGGWGKAYKESLETQIELKNKIVELNDLGFHVLLICHSKIVTFNDPLTESAYDRYELKLHESKSINIKALWREFVSAVFFINYDVFSVGQDKSARAQTSDKGSLFLFTKRTPAYDAKRRVEMPDKIKYEREGMFEVLSKYLSGANESTDLIYKETLSIVENLEDEELRKKLLSSLPKHKNNVEKLKEIQDYCERNQK